MSKGEDKAKKIMGDYLAGSPRLGLNIEAARALADEIVAEMKKQKVTFAVRD